MKTTDFCGISDAVDCINDNVYAAIDSLRNENIEMAHSQLNDAIKHTEYTLRRLTVIRDTADRTVLGF
jgi:hypothetical protein